MGAIPAVFFVLACVAVAVCAVALAVGVWVVILADLDESAGSDD